MSMKLKSYLSKKFEGRESFLENIVFPIFGEERFEDMYDVDALDNEDLQAMAQRTGIKSAILYGLVQIGTTEIYIYDVTVSDRVMMRRNRVGIQQLIRKIMETYTSAFIIFHYEDSDSWDWRFSFCQKDDKEVTEAKRYTFLLGPDQSCRTAAENFQKLIDKHGDINRDDIVQAFDVAALSDEFFGKYREHYSEFVKYITGKKYVKQSNNKYVEVVFHDPHPILYNRFGRDDKRVRDYIKKMLGRIVFLCFIEKKGWLGVKPNGKWNNGDKDFLLNLYQKANESQKNNFLEEILEPLFSMALNTDRREDGDVFDTHVRGLVNNGVVRIPYLNGGLFEMDKDDEVEVVFPKEYFENFLVMLSQYNFTIDENDPNDAEVGIDPEMLGRIFESLLEDNKDKGAFYTPKEIVQYMCRESLIAYLQTNANDDQKTAIRQFVTTYDTSVLSEELKDTVDQKLKDVKICDPAIGSGAFPMGLLRELYACRKTIEGIDAETAISIKTHIIQNNIYGVDIEKGAVDIARLRFWLALIVDEETPHALPNMDFKIMQGNSLLEQYEGVELSGLSLNEQKKRKAKKGQEWQQTFAFDEQYALDNIQNAIKEYYLTEDHNAKLNLRVIINENIRRYIINLKGCTAEVQRKIEKLPIPNNQFFLWHIYFKDVFDNGGFDIIIGNPPYFVYQAKHVGEIEALRKDKDYTIAFGGKLNAYKLFLANALKKLIKKNGINCFIFQNSFMGDKQATNLRKYVLENAQIINIESFPERDSKKKRVFEGVKMSVCIPIIRNSQSNNEFVVNIWDDKHKTSGLSTCFTKEDIKAIDSVDYVIPRLKKEYKETVIHMISKRAFSIKCYEGELNVTFHKAFFNQITSNPIILKGASIQRYYYTLQMSQGQIEYLDEVPYLAKFGNSEKSKHHRFERIAMQGMTGANDKLRIVMSIVPAGYYLGNSCNYILPQKNIATKALLAILNSKPINWFFRCFSTNSNVNGYEVDNLPLPFVDDKTQDDLVKLVDAIIDKKSVSTLSNISQEEDAINKIVYGLYDLSKKQIKIIET